MWHFSRTALAIFLLVFSVAACGDETAGSGSSPNSSGVTDAGDAGDIDDSDAERPDADHSDTDADEHDSSPAPECGNERIEDTEMCDDGNRDDGDGCASDCVIEEGWQCDEGEPTQCEPICGDGNVDGDEACDDGNTDDGDGCASDCTVE
ncbi:MAG: DUF4215 domain-containing protein, partial [Persicimonas sp.]